MLLKANSEVERLKAMKMLGMATLASGEAMGIFIEAVHVTSGQNHVEAAKPLEEALNVIMGDESTIAKLADDEGPLTADELADLTLLREGATQMLSQLSVFRAPSGEAGYRQMMTLKEWRAPALNAAKSLEGIAAAIMK